MKKIFLVLALVGGVFGAGLLQAEDIVLVDRIGKDSSNTDGMGGYTNFCSIDGCSSFYFVTPIKIKAAQKLKLKSIEFAVQGTSRNNYCEATWDDFTYKYLIWENLEKAAKNPVHGTLAHSDKNLPSSRIEFGKDSDDCPTYLMSFDLTSLKFEIQKDQSVFVGVLPVDKNRDSGYISTLESLSKREGESDAQLYYNAPSDGYSLTADYEDNQADGLYGIRVTATTLSETLPGDTNCDGKVNFDDIDPFVLALIDQDQFRSEFPNCNVENADVNLDDAVDFSDIDPFVEKLIG